MAQLVSARLLLLLTSADGLLGKVSGPGGKAVRIPVITDVESAFRHVTAEKGRLSTGGMGAKLQAVRTAVEAGVETVIAHGRKKGRITGAVAGEDVGTRFPAKRVPKRR